MSVSDNRPARAKQGGWIKPAQIELGPDDRPLCRWRRAEVPKLRRTFCSDACVHEWKLRTNPGYLHEHVLARDRGICAQCGIDTKKLRGEMRKLDYAARRQFLRKSLSRFGL